MKFTSIYLSNYIGIYNGMGLYDIQIDLTKCKNRIIIIRGDNGSGKSTLSKALSLFPDGNESFIPQMPARKEIILEDGGIIYKLVFIHNIKSNGERETTKAYITKSFNGQCIELNENGNVTSYKDILYDELGLDPNFAALSQLSTDDRGLADKKPSERKKFVNSIISSLETYNNIYKSLSKKSSSYKSLINAVTAKLSILGDINTLQSNLDAIDEKINLLQDKKDSAIIDLAKAQSTIKILDPDGSIQAMYDNTVISLNGLKDKLQISIKIISNLCHSNNISDTNIHESYKNLISAKNELIIQNQIDSGNLQTLIREQEIQNDELAKKTSKLLSLNCNSDYDKLIEDEKNTVTEMDEISALFINAGFNDFENISKDEYILALQTLKDLEVSISSFKDEFDYYTIESVINAYIQSNEIPKCISLQDKINDIANINNRIENLKEQKLSIESRISLLDRLKLRPSNCNISNCLFIKDALEFASTKPEEKLTQINEDMNLLSNEKINLEKDIEAISNYNNAINKLAIIIREVDKNGAILKKMPNSSMFANTLTVVENILNGYSFEYINQIYSYIDFANMLDVYKSLKEVLSYIRTQLNIYTSKNDIISEINSDIDRINSNIDRISSDIGPINEQILDRKKAITRMQELEGVYETLISELSNRDAINELIMKDKQTLLDISKKMTDIKAALESESTAKSTIISCNNKISPLMSERDKINHSIEMINDYVNEKEELQKNYEFIEVLKRYSSPTTGIQLIFMELYMGKIISLANELLSFLFQGQYSIQPFVINESEFRIPCFGGGYINDDISSMSSSQISMISMILSFALLHNSSTKYNIIKLDEIDGPLDYNNRMYFMEVLNKIMDIMNTEQCIMISHNSELQVDNSDVILLRHDGNNNDYLRGNIIWKYM